VPLQLLVIDSRPFLEFNTCHIVGAVNICCSKIVKRRLQQDKVGVRELLQHTCGDWGSEVPTVVVYDQASWDPNTVGTDSFLGVLLIKLRPAFPRVALLSGGFEEFGGRYPGLCRDQRASSGPSLTSLSQPCLPTGHQGPTRILPFLYLGSQQDAQNRDLLRDHSITYELNVSASCPKPEFIQETQFMRIPVNDNYSEKLMPYFASACRFLDKVRESGGCVLVHCLAGISRSPTVAIAYVMRHLRLSSDDAYRYVKAKRPSISPNFNFLGQLLEYEKQLRRERVLGPCAPPCPASPSSGCPKRLYPPDTILGLPESLVTLGVPRSPGGVAPADLSPTSALARLSFDRSPAKRASYEVVRSQSCHLGWLGSARPAGTPPALDAFPVVLRRKASGRRDPNAHDSAYRSLTLDEVVELNQGCGPEPSRLPLPGSPLSPSESHFLQDFEEDVPGEDGCVPGGQPWQSCSGHFSTSTELEGSHDSGVTSASSCSSWSRSAAEPSAPQPRQGWPSSSRQSSSSASSSSSLASQDDDDRPQGKMAPSPAHFHGPHALPRTQSCPVIQGWLRRTSSLDEFPQPPRLSQPRNRYSCGSLEYQLCELWSQPHRGQSSEPQAPLCRSANMIQV
ncbi:unnamed protein product, partial [Ixodes hexagonus]